MGKGAKAESAARATSSLLFRPEELALRATGQSRLRALARRRSRPLSQIQHRIEEDRKTMKRLRTWSERLACEFRLRTPVLEAEREGINEYYGICYEDGLIRIRLRHARTGRLLKESSLVDTLCHELAHLRYMDHGLRFRKLYQRILDTARDQGYYRPGPVDASRPRQGRLFDLGSCGTGAT